MNVDHENYIFVDIEHPHYATVCLKCGAIVRNEKIHTEFHNQIEEKVKQ